MVVAESFGIVVDRSGGNTRGEEDLPPRSSGGDEVSPSAAGGTGRGSLKGGLFPSIRCHSRGLRPAGCKMFEIHRLEDFRRIAVPAQALKMLRSRRSGCRRVLVGHATCTKRRDLRSIGIQCVRVARLRAADVDRAQQDRRQTDEILSARANADGAVEDDDYRRHRPLGADVGLDARAPAVRVSGQRSRARRSGSGDSGQEDERQCRDGGIMDGAQKRCWQCRVRRKVPWPARSPQGRRQ